MSRTLWTALCFIVSSWFASPSTPVQIPDLDRVGTAVNVLTRQGDLTLEFRVVPDNDSQPWLFKRDPTYVFQDIQVQRTDFGKIGGEFRMEMCRGKDELLASYFRNYYIDGVEWPWKYFSNSWTESKQVRTLGIDSPLNNDFGYILLKLDFKKAEYQLSSAHTLNAKIGESFKKISVNDAESVKQFYATVGTHYVHSYTTGNSIFQVVAFNMSHFDLLRKKLMESGSSRLTFAYLSKYMSPLFAKNIGRVMVTSGEQNLIDWVNEILTRKETSSQIKFPALVSLSWKPWLLDQIVNRIDANTVLSLRLDSFDRTFANSSPVVHWYREITANALKLREVNS